MKRKEYLEKLANVGIVPKIEKDGEGGLILVVNGFTINGDNCFLFGYNPRTVSLRFVSYSEQSFFSDDCFDRAVGLIIGLLKRNQIQTVDYHSIFDFLDIYCKTKIDINSKQRIKNIVKENFNVMLRNKVS